ncbi:MAG: hypothetical protein LZF61_08330 [Nitrosomonas sp.]|nr:MAG: hypothetical protein LZF61_08330 [Nitrosomonas sp.]
MNVAADSVALSFLSDMSVAPDLGLAYGKKLRAWKDEDTSDDGIRKWFLDLDYTLANPNLSEIAAGKVSLIKGFLDAITQDVQQFDTPNCLGNRYKKLIHCVLNLLHLRQNSPEVKKMLMDNGGLYGFYRLGLPCLHHNFLYPGQGRKTDGSQIDGG